MSRLTFIKSTVVTSGDACCASLVRVLFYSKLVDVTMPHFEVIVLSSRLNSNFKNLLNRQNYAKLISVNSLIR
jgi:hypothetical protein